jgi:hypothetical protein
MRDCPARHVPCGAHHGHGLKEEGSPYEQQACADVPPLSRVHEYIQGADGVSGEKGEQGGEEKASLRARAVYEFSTQHLYSTAYSHRREEPPFLDTFSSEFQRS